MSALTHNKPYITKQLVIEEECKSFFDRALCSLPVVDRLSVHAHWRRGRRRWDYGDRNIGDSCVPSSARLVEIERLSFGSGCRLAAPRSHVMFTDYVSLSTERQKYQRNIFEWLSVSSDMAWHRCLQLACYRAHHSDESDDDCVTARHATPFRSCSECSEVWTYDRKRAVPDYWTNHGYSVYQAWSRWSRLQSAPCQDSSTCLKPAC